MEKSNKYSVIAAKNIRFLSVEKGIPIGDFEDAMCVSKGTLARIVNNKDQRYYLSIDNLYGLLEKMELGLSIDQLLDEKLFIEYKIAQMEAELEALKAEREAIKSGEQHGKDEQRKGEAR